MPVKRALVDCAVLSLQDTCVVYPFCKECFSRINIEQQDTRYRCPKCGFSCAKEKVDYRYRLSLRVARDSYIFGVTVFGTCLNSLFGVSASGLHRLVDSNEAVKGATRSTLLSKAVRDCFIGRHLIFGLKITGNSPFSGGPATLGGSWEDRAQFIATQIILPEAAALKGCSVVKYYQALLRQAAECPLGCTSPSKSPRQPATLLLIPQPSSNCSFGDSPSDASWLLSETHQRSLHHDCTLSPTPLLQQSLGLVTSSAEQEEGCSSQGSTGELNSRQMHSQRPRPLRHAPEWESAGLGILEGTGKRAASPSRLSFREHSWCSGMSFHSLTTVSDERSCSSPSQACHSRTTAPLSDGAKNISDVDCSLGTEAWQDLPFSESLDAFLCDEDAFWEVEQKFPQNESERPCRDASQQPPREESSAKDPVALCRSNIQLSEAVSHRKVLVDISNAAAHRHGDDGSQTCWSSCRRDRRSQAIHVSYIDNTEFDTSVSACVRTCQAAEESLELCVYDCSADLFNGSSMRSISTAPLETHGDGDKNNITVPHPHTTLRSEPDVPCNDSVNCSCLVHCSNTPAKQVVRTDGYTDADHCEKLSNLRSTRKANVGLISSPNKFQCHQFIPPSQSTPIVKLGTSTGLPTSTHRTRALAASSWMNPVLGDSDAVYSNTSKWACEKTGETALLLQGADVEHNSVCRTTPRRESHKRTQDNTVVKPYRPKRCLVAHPCLTLQRERARSRASTDQASTCDYADDKAIVPPGNTKTQPHVKLRRQEQADKCGEDRGYSQREQSGDACKRTLLTQAVTPAYTLPDDIERTASIIYKSPVKGSLSSTNKHTFFEESEAFNCSSDLFSD